MKSLSFLAVVATFIFAPVVTSELQANPACGNDKTPRPPPCPCPTCPCNGSSGGDNVIDAYTGNARRSAIDLQVWGAVGQTPLQWQRIHNTRVPTTNGLVQSTFGQGGYWQDNYSYTLISDGSASVVNPDTGATQTVAVLELQLPSGEDYTFTQQATNANLYLPIDNVPMTLTNNSGTYVVQTATGYQYFFSSGIGIYGTQTFQFTGVQDPQGILQTVSYDSKGNLIKVSDPTGRYLSISYETIKLSPSPSSLTVISKVTTSDGRSVNYTYTPQPDTSRPSDEPWLMLTSATYGDGTQALYTYQQWAAGYRPMLVEAIDPRQGENSVHILYTYWPLVEANGDTNVLGQVQSEADGATGETIASVNANGVHTPYFLYANGRQVTYLYTNGSVMTQTDGLGHTISYTYTAGTGLGFVASMTDKNGNVIHYTRDNYSLPLTTTYPDGTVDTQTYDSLEQPLSDTITGPSLTSRTTTWTRDSQHRVTQITYPDSSYETFTYNSFNEVLSHRLRNGGTESNTYDPTGLKVTSVDALGNTATYTYNSNSLVATMTDPRGNVTSYQYTERGQVSQVTNADGSNKTFSYDDFGNMIATTNEIGNTWNATYDTFKRLTSKTDPLGRTTEILYGVGTGGAGGCGACNSSTNPTQIVLPSGKEIDYTYDVEWHKLSATVGAGTTDAATTSYAYDPNGNPTQVTDPNGNVTHLAYDSRDRKLSSTDPLNHITKWTYDGDGNILTVTRPDGGVTTNTYDAMDRLISSTDPKSQTTSYGYDNIDDLTSLTDASGNATTFTYDLLKRKTKKTYADNSFEQWTFNDTANTSTASLVDQKPAGQTESTYLDVRNRVAQKSYSDSTPGVTYSYDNAGRTVSLVSSVSSLGYTYDAANQLLSESQNIAGSAGAQTVAYTYDADGNKATITYPDGTVVTNSYTNCNQVSQIASTLSSRQQASYTYDADGSVLSRQLDNGTTTAYAYDAAERLTDLQQSMPTGTTTVPFETLTYAYNSVNDRTNKETTNAANPSGTYEVYSYDPIDQVTKAAYNATNSSGASATRNVAYSLDPLGNRTNVNDTGSATAYTPNNLNQYTAVGGSSLTYDGNGNLASGPGTYAYDAKNRLISATVGGTTMTLAYDGLNRCVSRTLGGNTYYLVYDGWNLIDEYLGTSTTPNQTYVHGQAADEMVAKKDSSGAVVYYCADALGSSIYLTNASGAIAEHYTYDIYGKPSIFDPSGNSLTKSAYGNRFLFTGREYLAAVNLYDYRHRLYSADLGRWLSRDPLKSAERTQGPDLYEYVKNNPINMTDFMGLARGNPSHCPCTQHLAPAWKILGYSSQEACAGDQLANEFGGLLGLSLTTTGSAGAIGGAPTLTPGTSLGMKGALGAGGAAAGITALAGIGISAMTLEIVCGTEYCVPNGSY